ncbi:MAG: tetratricopeptide repeat protein, partial [Methanoregula sp.]|nr:tetratricopeptide repeat protein [Methanoregula sp.]
YLYSEAVASYDKALALNPDYADAWRNRGVALGNLAMYQEAVDSYDKAIAIDQNDVDTWYNRGFALGKLGQFSKAIASYDKALALNPDYADAWRNRGVALGNLAMYSEAVGSYYNAIASYYKAIVPEPKNTSVKQNPETTLKKQTQPVPLLYAPVSAIVLMAGIAVWGRRRDPPRK